MEQTFHVVSLSEQDLNAVIRDLFLKRFKVVGKILLALGTETEMNDSCLAHFVASSETQFCANIRNTYYRQK